MKKQSNSNSGLVKEIRNALKGKQVPVLVLDNRWHRLFPPGEKPEDVTELEEEVNELLKRQGYLVNDIKELKATKKRLMDGIVAGMQKNSEFDDKKKDKQQSLLLEINERIAEDSNELTQLPGQIRDANEALLVTGARYCFERLESGDSEIEELKAEIRELKEKLHDKTDRKDALAESMESAYSLMHGILGHSVMNMYDKSRKKK